ncbi:MAG: hypothetical protein JW915_11970 [Chitinispirillaceae bacterium]|nr:hypothetical protein [Chitinispirillaceae bacterium]
MSIRTVSVTMAAAVFLLFGSCKETGNPTQVSTDGKVYGVFSVFIDQVSNRTQFTGKLYDGPIPNTVWDTVKVIGECKLFAPKQSTCQNCGTGYVCVDDNNCQKEPDTITAGTLTVTGWENKGATATSTIEATNGTYMPTLDDRPKNPPFSEGETMTITASGNEVVAGFTISAKTISPIEVYNDSIVMNPGEPILLKWKAADNPDNSKMKVVIDISYHGGTKAKIECDCRDDGELEIPAVLLDSLKSYGMSGHPKMELYRQSFGTDPGTGVEVKIEAFMLLWIKIPGLISCSVDSQCPDGQVCAGDQRCREVQ